MKRSMLAGASVAIIFVIALGIEGFRANGADDRQTASISLAKQEKAIAEEALKLLTTLESQGQLNVTVGEVPRWSRRLVEATHKSGASQAEIAEAIKQHIGRMEQRLNRLKKLYEAQAATYGDVLNAKYEALEAQALALD